MSPVQATLFNMPQSEWENLASLLSLAVALVAAAALLLRVVPSQWIAHANETFRRWAAPGALWFVLLPALSLALNIGIAFHKGSPVPIIHDEFSYLLAGDTFAHGRLTNPSPPFVEHFETPQELMRPTRMSKYPPGQGLFIALGEVLTATPIVGIWISTAAACAAVYWMLLGFCSKPWALLGGLIAVASPALLAWSQVYWGGCVAVLGSALMVGGWGRLMRERSPGAAVMMFIGVAVLANSRPFEGMMVCLPLMVGLIFGTRPVRFDWLWPGVIVLGLTAAWMGWYNYRITGNPLRLPFVEYTRQYDVFPKFWFQPLRPIPEYGNRSQRWVHTDFEKGQYDQLRTLRGFLGISPLRAGALLSDNLKLAALFIPVAVALSLLRDLRIRCCFISAAVLLLALLCENFDLPHYSAPVYPVLLVLVIAGLEKLWNWNADAAGTGERFGGGTRTMGVSPMAAHFPQRLRASFPGRPEQTIGETPMVLSTPPQPLGTLAAISSEAGLQPHRLEYRQKQPEFRRFPLGQLLTIAIVIGFTAGAAMCICEGVSRDSQIVQQTRLVDLQPALYAGRHLIFVNYGPMTELTSGFANEYVYNAANLDSSRIIWVRYFGPVLDRPVADHFTGRTIWMLDVGAKLELKPYLRSE